MWEPRHPSLKVVFSFSFLCWGIKQQVSFFHSLSLSSFARMLPFLLVCSISHTWCSWEAGSSCGSCGFGLLVGVASPLPPAPCSLVAACACLLGVGGTGTHPGRGRPLRLVCFSPGVDQGRLQCRTDLEIWFPGSDPAPASMPKGATSDSSLFPQEVFFV